MTANVARWGRRHFLRSDWASVTVSARTSRKCFYAHADLRAVWLYKLPMLTPFDPVDMDNGGHKFPVLYSFRRCPYAMRARLAISVSGTACVLREVKLSAKPQAMVAASPKGTVPVLVLPDNEVIDQSLDIMRWVLTQRDPENWLSGDDGELIEHNDGPFKHDLDRYKYPDRYEVDPLRHRGQAMEFLLQLDDRLARSRQLCGTHRSLTDAAIMPFVRQFSAVDRNWFESQPLPRLRHWLADHTSSGLFDVIMLRVPPWTPGESQILLPPIPAV